MNDKKRLFELSSLLAVVDLFFPVLDGFAVFTHEQVTDYVIQAFNQSP